MAISGFGGQVKIGTNRVAQINQWELEIKVDEGDATTFDSNGWKEVVSGLRSWSIKFEAKWNVANDANGQKALQDALLGGTTVSLDLYVNGTNKYSGTALITTWTVTTPADDVVTLKFEGTGTGALTYT